MIETYLKRSDVVDLVYKARRMEPVKGTFTDTYSWANQFVSGTTPADVRENKRGRWLAEQVDAGNNFPIMVFAVKCSHCGYYSGTETNYCPNCGTDMRKE